MSEKHGIYGLMAQFRDADALLEATRELRREYRHLEAYSPFPVEGMQEALALDTNRVPLFALGGGLFGALSGFFIQYYSAVIDYPINVGGRPLFSWVAFLPITVILTLLWTGAGAVLGMFVLNRLPRLYYPTFNATAFADASRSGFFLLVRADEPLFNAKRIERQMAALDAHLVEEVPL
jgi:hypothetical protein